MAKSPVIQLKRQRRHSGKKANQGFLNSGHDRDETLFSSLKTVLRAHALDYSENAIEAINQKAKRRGLSQFVTAVCHDVRKPLPFSNESLDVCYCHMLYCMALNTRELESLSQEVRRVLKPSGLNIYTVRNTDDPHYRTGTHRGEDMYELAGGFVVHFFSREKVKHLSKGYEIVSIDEFEEGKLPKKLFLVTLRKPS